MLQKKPETEDKAQGGVSDSSADTQKKEVEFSENPKRPERSEEGSSDSDGDEQEAMMCVLYIHILHHFLCLLFVTFNAILQFLGQERKLTNR